MNTNTYQTFLPQMRACVAALLTSAGLACAQAQPVLIFEHAGLGTMLQHEKDRGVLKALSMLPERLGELPREIPGMDRQVGGLLQLAATTIHRPMRFALVANPDDPSDGGFGYGMVVSIDTANQGDAEQLDALLHMALQNSDMPYEPKASRRFTGQSEVATPFAMFRFGPESTRDQWRYQITAGSIGDVPEIFDNNLRGVEGFTPVMRLRMDPAGLEAALTMAENAVPQDQFQAHEAIQAIRSMGLTEEGGPKVDSVMGYSKTHAISHTVITNMKKFSEQMGISSANLTAKELAILPKDIVFGSVGRGNFDQLITMTDQMSKNGLPVEAFLDEVQTRLGVDLINDFIVPMGDLTAVYASDTTGGGGLSSMVMVMKLDDPERFATAMTKLGSRANITLGQESPEASRYVEFDRWQHEGHTMLSVHAKGLPIPVEPTITISGSWMVVGMTPNAAVAAMEQATGKAGSSILDNPHVARAEVGNVIKFSFMDTERLARIGYGQANLMATAISSAVRAPGNGTRDAGLIISNFHDLMKGVKPTISTTHWEGDNLVMQSTSDPSTVVNAAAGMGLMQQYIAPIVGAIAVPAMLNMQRTGGMRGNWGRNDEWAMPIEIESVAFESDEDESDCTSSCEKSCTNIQEKQ